MIGIPFWGSAIETPRMLPVTACQPPFGSRKQLAGGADSPRNPISAQTVSDKGHYVNPRSVFRAEPDVASNWERMRVLTLTGYPSIFLGTVSLSNRKKDPA